MFYLQIDDEISLKLLEKKEAPLFFQMTEQSRDHLRQWLGWVDYTRTLKDSKQFIKAALQKYEEMSDVVTLVWYRGTPAGSLALYDIKWNNYSASIGYWLVKGLEGNGIMSRACSGLISYAFSSLQLNRLELRAALGNKKSRAIAERLGFTNEGTLQQGEWLYDHFTDVVLYRMLAEEWKH
ncbi:GCN5-like N-acetyltransferase [Fictibacillus macauensis ZFHKF-1]|uniref:GCN5-like N-acetyltransferase n=1 Tax=Fictibacillus macauensis ZFHKF-1 TaxID=1196324 RepID=I8AHG2_9BACL|nr:GNAT family protein [Fictibacillus macauensis]EIT84884.1 GCN5-like N-acetyltransferase [Fictibacillus macauensis ZFHKF-1]